MRLIAALACIAGAGAAAWSCRSMSAMGDIPMPGGWSMSAIWAPMCGQTSLGSAIAFVGMWTSMMAAMTLPWWTVQWRRFWHGCRSYASQGTHVSHRSRWETSARAALATLLTSVGYLLVWVVVGTIVFALGNGLATDLPHAPTLARFVPLFSAALVVIAGAVQFTPWKARHIACGGSGDAGDSLEGIAPHAACKLGVRAALQEGCGCANLMVVLLVIGVMDVCAMLGITAAMSLERLMPADRRAARGIGAVIVGTGLSMAVRAALVL